MPPTVSVVLPVLNGAPFLAAAMESILAQSVDDLELIVIDDGSNDASPEIAAACAARDRRVRCLRLPRDLATAGRDGSTAGSGLIAI